MQTLHSSFGEHATTSPPLSAPQLEYSYPPTPHDWARVQSVIYEYYVVQNLPLHSVRSYLQDTHNFKASERMIKARLAKWEYIKNAKREDWGYLAVLHDLRKLQNKNTSFVIRGHRKTVRDLQRFIRNQNISTQKFLAESWDHFRRRGEQIPDYIRAYTPEPEEALSSPSTDTSFSFALGGVRSPSPCVTESTQGVSRGLESGLFLSPRGTSFGRSPSAVDDHKHLYVYDSHALEPNNDFLNSKNDNRMGLSLSKLRHNRKSMQLYLSDSTRLRLEAYSTQILQPVELHTRIGHYDFRGWQIVDPPNIITPPDSDDEMEEDWRIPCFPSLDLFEPKYGLRNILNDNTTLKLNIPASTRDEGAWVWMSLCFLACMALKRGDNEIAEEILDRTDQKFEILLRTRDEMLLTAAGLMMTILHQHDQEAIAVRIAKRARAVAERLLPEKDPIRITILYLALSANANGQDLLESGFKPKRLCTVYEEFRETYDSTHPYVIAALANYAWLLKWQGDNEKAAPHAIKAFKLSRERFGCLHLQTVVCLSIFTGCLGPNHLKHRIASYRRIVRRAAKILGIIHPYTLEALRRLADSLYRNGEINTALEMDRSVLFGRATMLGKEHKFTVGQRNDYEERLRQHGRWENKEGEPSREQVQIEELFDQDLEQVWARLSRAIMEFCKIEPSENEDTALARRALRTALSRSASPCSSCDEYQAF